MLKAVRAVREHMQKSLFSPICIGGVDLPNRIVVSPMCQYAAVEGLAQPWHWFHIGGLAMSGAGLVIMEATAVEPRGRINSSCLGLYTDEHEAALTRLVSEVKSVPGTSRLGIQLSHAGRKASTHKTWERGRGPTLVPGEGGWSVVGPTSTPFGDGWAVPTELDGDGLRSVRQAFVTAAARAVRCGFDMIEIQAAHGYLLHSFISPITNRRSDAYGGDMDARMRFPLEILQSVRSAIPSDRALGVRITGSDWLDGGLTLDDGVTFGKALKAIGVDCLTPSGGNLAPGVKFPAAKPGYMVHFAQRIRREVGLSTIAVGMICDAPHANQIIEDGDADCVALARAFIDNPRWGWHAAAFFDQEVIVPPQYNLGQPLKWPLYRHVHGFGPVAEGGAMTHASRD